MPKPLFPANAEGLSKFERRLILAGGAAVFTTAVVPQFAETETIDEEIMKLWFQLNPEQKRDVLDNFFGQRRSSSLSER
ncbi:hypothetical protein [Brucella pituitosa]|uniref:Uncharacterized protein n=1 Tax=Brucella pituitosa TaxID=571256 RepID=A0ABS3JU40_9HYPH|nr:hypothetical protein [Brucella pituitosa]MBO1038189.1 hypothetical protein [Brucella pituitosa]